MAPLHHMYTENPTLSYQQDLDVVQKLDDLLYDEVWFGEHHSTARELFPNPAIVVAAAAQRTRRIKLGSAIIALGLHHPFHVADEWNMLDHLTQGRAILGIGTGGGGSDWAMCGFGVDTGVRRKRTDEGLAALMVLFGFKESLTTKTDWFEAVEAHLQLAPYTTPHVPIVVVGSGQGSSRLAGRYGLGLIIGGPPQSPDPDAAFSYQGLAKQWATVEEAAEQHGKPADRGAFHFTQFVHLAETRQEAFDQVRRGFRTHPSVHLVGVQRDGVSDEFLPERAAAQGKAIIGTPDDAIEILEYALRESGGFGGFVMSYLGLANRENSLRSFELFARYVAPRFQGQYEHMRAHDEWIQGTPSRGPQADPFPLPLLGGVDLRAGQLPQAWQRNGEAHVPKT